MIAADDALINEKRIELGCGLDPFMGHMLGYTDKNEIYRRTSDLMIIYYDKEAKRCWVLDDADKLSEYLDDANCEQVSQALERLNKNAAPAKSLP